jgi:hypothetical protein
MASLSTVNLPIHAELSSEELNRVIDACNR